MSSLFWDVTWRSVVARHRSFGTAYGSHLQGSSSTRLTALLDFQISIGCPEPPATSYQPTLRKHPRPTKTSVDTRLASSSTPLREPARDSHRNKFTAWQQDGVLCQTHSCRLEFKSETPCLVAEGKQRNLHARQLSAEDNDENYLITPSARGTSRGMRTCWLHRWATAVTEVPCLAPQFLYPMVYIKGYKAPQENDRKLRGHTSFWEDHRNFTPPNTPQRSSLSSSLSLSKVSESDKCLCKATNIILAFISVAAWPLG
jgi:hypothetical protein